MSCLLVVKWEPNKLYQSNMERVYILIVFFAIAQFQGYKVYGNILDLYSLLIPLAVYEDTLEDLRLYGRS